MKKEGRWIPNLRLVCKNWGKSVDERILHISIDVEDLKGANVRVKEALQALKEKLPRLETIRCIDRDSDQFRPMYRKTRAQRISLEPYAQVFPNEVIWVPLSMSSDSINMEYLPRFSNLKALCFDGSFSTTPFSSFSGLTRLEVGDLKGNTLERMTMLTNLQKLCLGITRLDMQALRFFPSLVDLEFWKVREVTNEAALCALTSLTRISFIYGFVTKPCLPHLSSLTNLREVYFYGGYGGEEVVFESFQTLSSLQGLTRLDLIDLSIEDELGYVENATLLENFSHLKYLQIEGERWGSLTQLTKLAQLRTLLLNYPLETDDFGALVLLQSLETLSFDAYELDKEECFEVVSNLGNLRNLGLSNIPEDLLGNLGKLRQLRQLRMLARGVDSLVQLTRLKKLEVLEVDFWNESEITVLTHLTCLTQLCLRGECHKGINIVELAPLRENLAVIELGSLPTKKEVSMWREVFPFTKISVSPEERKLSWW